MMATKRKASEPESGVIEASIENSNELIITISQFEKLTDDQKQAFRAANGTVSNLP